jgi:hypothetical protein
MKEKLESLLKRLEGVNKNNTYLWTKRAIMVTIVIILSLTGFKFISGFLAGFIFPGILKSFGDFLETLITKMEAYLGKDKL